MNPAFVSPRATQELELQGVTFLYRALNAEDAAELLFNARVADGKAEVEFNASAHSIAVRKGLVGWKGEGAPAYPGNAAMAIELLSQGVYIALGTAILNATFLSPAQVGN